MTQRADYRPVQSHRSARQSAGAAWLLRSPAARLLIALLLFIIGAPFLVQHRSEKIVTSLLVTLVFVNSSLAMGRDRWISNAAKLLLVFALATRWFAHVRPDMLPEDIFPATAMLFIGVVFASVFHFILCAPEVDSETLCAGVCGYLLLGLFWAFAYSLVNDVSPNAFAIAARPPWPRSEMKDFTAMFFSFTALTSAGNSDIVPVAPVAQMLYMTETMAGAFYMAVMIARLVALNSSRRQKV